MTTACRVIEATPSYVDIEADSRLITIRAAFASVSAKKAAVIVTYLYDRLADVGRLRLGLKTLE